MRKAILENITKVLESAPPGPWAWKLNTQTQSVSLQNKHKAPIMIFQRWGRSSAKPAFQSNGQWWGPDEIPNHPVMDFIENSPGYVLFLLNEIDRLKVAIKQHRNDFYEIGYDANETLWNNAQS